jgi:hypothetical protein
LSQGQVNAKMSFDWDSFPWQHQAQIVDAYKSTIGQGVVEMTGKVLVHARERDG